MNSWHGKGASFLDLLMDPYLSSWAAGKGYGLAGGGKKGKSKVKGKSGFTQKGKGKGKADHDDAKVPPPPNQVYPRPQKTDGHCTCCGKPKHSKTQCWHREKGCNFCGRIGHIEAMCRDKVDAGNDAATTLDKEKDGDKAKQKKKEWQCTHCAGSTRTKM